MCRRKTASRRNWRENMCSGAAIQMLYTRTSCIPTRASKKGRVCCVLFRWVVTPLFSRHARGAFSCEARGFGARFFHVSYSRRKHDSLPSLRHSHFAHTACHGLLIFPKPHDPGHGARWAQVGSRCAGVSITRNVRPGPFSCLSRDASRLRPASQPANQRNERAEPVHGCLQ